MDVVKCKMYDFIDEIFVYAFYQKLCDQQTRIIDYIFIESKRCTIVNKKCYILKKYNYLYF